jgi:hypothetical protein
MRLILFNARFLVLLYIQALTVFQSFDRTVFNCEVFCRNLHILYTLSLPLFLLTTATMTYLLVSRKSLFNLSPQDSIQAVLCNVNRALLWIWLAMGTISYVAANTNDTNDLRGAFASGVMLSALI